MARNELATIQSWTQHFTHGAIGTNANGERAMYLAGAVRSKETCIFLDVALDNSGSMDAICGGGKSRLAVSLECIQSIIKDPTLQLQFPDSFVLRTFNGYILERFKTHPENFDHQRMLTNISYKPGDNGKTRVWDAMGKTLADMLEHTETHRNGQEVVRYMLVLTDGGDNASKDTVQDVGRKLVEASRKLKNLHVLVLAAGLGAGDLRQLEMLTQLCHGKVDVRIISVQKVDDVNIRQAFSKAMEEIRALLFKTKDGNMTVTTFRSRDPSKVQRVDMAAAAQIRGFEKTQVITQGNSDMRGLIALMSSSSLR
ncbi:hypothetical protein TSOC_008175 [Tetrabaena socialis]|uniref:VWFA domain-containing protein n=1 Tax=Tetrabaena socialis TaxID=47790 RepID=A0A2J7ZZ56_9CHLO|nr:hypothetical protein TSOC_008175 [Tetrabaena socialis]|eukprot:PNH05543.1 hypothetical protein TSOC_008175 [Tetrabaena socialis]